MNFSTENNRINLLPEHLIDQIKAGEVVERPANVLKELLENSCDAGSSEIKITLKENGLDLIAIEDDGNGMFYEELPYAFCRHATSKITSFEDIYKLNTFGFRGEALASISSVSRISCHSAPKKDLESGGKILIHGAQTKEHTYYRPSKSGTSIYVKDLFYNTPVRLKFVKSKISEKNALSRIINAFLFTYPQIKFSVTWDEKDREIYPGVSLDNIQQRIKNIIGRKKTTNIITTEASYLGSKIKIYASKESTKGYTGKHHYLFVNNRLFTDKKIHQIIIRNMEKYWPYGQTGHYFAQFEVPEHEIDVNVHPNKTLIKFLKANEIFSLVSATVKKLIEENKEEAPVHENEVMEFSQATPIEEMMSSPIWTRIGNEEQTSFDSTPSTGRIGQVDLFSGESDQNIIECGHNIFILKTNDSGLYFLNMENAITHLISELEKESEVQVTPLLISEPITKEALVNEQLIIDELREIGFELDRIDSRTLVLRSTPTAFESYDYKSLIEIILNDIKLIDGKLSYTHIDFSSINIGQKNTTNYVKDFSIVNMIEAKVAKKFKGQDIKKKFYGKK